MHPQIIQSLALLGSISLAAANDVVSLILPYADDQDLVGDVIGSDGPTTTYVVKCPSGTDAVDCGMPSGGMTMTVEPTAFAFEYGFDDYYLSESCKHSGTTWVSCKVTNTQSDFSLVTSTDGSMKLPRMPVTITATATDADIKPSATATPTATSTSGSKSASDSDSDSDSDSNSESESESESTSSSTPSSNEADPEETNSDNAAMPRATGAATQWIVSGAGMALALALA